MMEIPHFGKRIEINICVKLFLCCVHGGFLWLDREISINTYLIAQITGFPSVGEYPLKLFTEKMQEKALVERMKEKYGTFSGVCRLDVASINEDTIRFATQVLEYKLPRKCFKDQVPVGVIEATENFVAGVMMNWSTFLMNQFLMDCKEEHEKGTLVPLCMVINFDSIDCFEGVKRDAVPRKNS